MPTADQTVAGEGAAVASQAPQTDKSREGRSPGQVAWDRLKKDKVAIVCFAIVMFFILVAIFAPLLTSLQAPDPTTGAKADPTTTNMKLIDRKGYPIVGPSSSHWLGLEMRMGRDLFARWSHGARPSLIIGFTAAIASTVIGTLLGLTAGYLGGWVDRIISWFTDFFLSLPLLLLVLAVVPLVQIGFSSPQASAEETSQLRMNTLIVILVLFGWMGLCRLVRGEVVSLREREFVQAARAIGVPTRQILVKEILPNLVGPIIVSASIAVPAYITFEATLSYLGAGLVEPIPSWGRTISDAQTYYQSYPLYFWPSVLSLSLLVLALSLLGDSIRDAFDPTSRR